MAIQIDRGLVEPLFAGISDDTLVFACAPSLRPLVSLDLDDRPVDELAWDGDGARAALLDLLQRFRGDGRRASVLWMSDSEFKHFSPEELGNARVAGWTFFSSEPTEQSIHDAVDVTRRTDYSAQEKLEGRFLDLMDDADHLVITDRRVGCRAVVTHQDCDHWFSLNGPLRPGQQTVLPSGELSILADESGSFSATLLPIDGEVLLYGETLVHRGDDTISRSDARRAYERMAALADAPAVATVEGGSIVDVRPVADEAGGGADVLRWLFDTDDRYRKIHELGFGTNAACRPLHRGNFFGDERHPGLHFGLGLGGHLDFHFDIVCPDSTVLACTDGSEIDVLADVGLR